MPKEKITVSIRIMLVGIAHHVSINDMSPANKIKNVRKTVLPNQARIRTVTRIENSVSKLISFNL